MKKREMDRRKLSALIEIHINKKILINIIILLIQVYNIII